MANANMYTTGAASQAVTYDYGTKQGRGSLTVEYSSNSNYENSVTVAANEVTEHARRHQAEGDSVNATAGEVSNYCDVGQHSISTNDAEIPSTYCGASSQALSSYVGDSSISTLDDAIALNSRVIKRQRSFIAEEEPLKDLVISDHVVVLLSSSLQGTTGCTNAGNFPASDSYLRPAQQLDELSVSPCTIIEDLSTQAPSSPYSTPVPPSPVMFDNDPRKQVALKHDQELSTSQGSTVLAQALARRGHLGGSQLMASDMFGLTTSASEYMILSPDQSLPTSPTTPSFPSIVEQNACISNFSLDINPDSQVGILYYDRAQPIIATYLPTTADVHGSSLSPGRTHASNFTQSQTIPFSKEEQDARKNGKN